MEEIISPGNAGIKRLVLLRQKQKERRQTRSFIVEGERLVLDTPPRFLREVYVTRKAWEGLKGRMLSLGIREETVTLLSEEAMRKASDTKTPQGILAVASMPDWRMTDLLQGTPAPLLLMLEDIQDPGNLGTMVRTAEASGASGILAGAGTADLYQPKAVRATMSAVFRVPYLLTEDLPGAMQELRRGYGVRFCAACPGTGSKSYESVDYTCACGILIGNEARGLTRETIAAADEKIHIPMAGRTESLNAAMSAGILLYEAARQRGFPALAQAACADTPEV